MDLRLPGFNLKEVQPAVLNQVANHGVLLQNAIDCAAISFKEDTEAERGVAQAGAVVERLQGQSNPQIAAVAFKDADVATDRAGAARALFGHPEQPPLPGALGMASSGLWKIPRPMIATQSRRASTGESGSSQMSVAAPPSPE